MLAHHLRKHQKEVRLGSEVAGHLGTEKWKDGVSRVSRGTRETGADSRLGPPESAGNTRTHAFGPEGPKDGFRTVPRHLSRHAHGRRGRIPDTPRDGPTSWSSWPSGRRGNRSGPASWAFSPGSAYAVRPLAGSSLVQSVGIP